MEDLKKRILKFRAWLPMCSKMAYEIEKDSDLNIILEDDGKCYVVMQYTGIRDKNGREIYEGDIVEAWSQGVKAIGRIMQRIDGLWMMFPAWQNEGFWYLFPDGNGNETVEVIGNVYENPELLKGEPK